MTNTESPSAAIAASNTTPAAARIQSRSQSVATEIANLIRAKNVLIWISTREESRVEAELAEIAVKTKFVPRVWDCATGTSRAEGEIEPWGSTDIDETLNQILERATKPNTRADRGLWILRDAHEWIAGQIGIQTRRKLRNLARRLPITDEDRAQTIIILSPSSQIPDELAGHTTVIDWPLPDRLEIGEILDDATESNGIKVSPDTREAAIDAAIGLNEEEASNCFSKSLVIERNINPRLIVAEKKKIITREKVLEWIDPLPGGLESVGGLNSLRGWFIARRQAYSPAARAYRLPPPRGVMIVGISGCGKSLIIKAIGTLFGIPTLRMDLGSLLGKYVGESQANIRRAFKVIEAIGRCIVWFDEIEKMLPAGGTAAADGGVSADQLGQLLYWTQERAGEAFLAATANDPSVLPYELLRRFDEIFSVDTPNETERGEIAAVALRNHGRNPTDFDLAEIALNTIDFTGDEIAKLIPKAMFESFADGERELSTTDILSVARSVVPLTKTSAEKVAAFRAWSKERARPATTQQTSKSNVNFRRLEFAGSENSLS